MPRLVLQTAMISAFELCKKKAIPIQFAAKVPRLGTIGKNHIQSRFNLSEESVLFFCSESDTFLRNYTIKSNEKEAEHPVFTRDCRHDTGCGKLPVFVGWHRGFTRSLRRFECFWLFDFKTGHEPVELLPGQLLYFQLISGQAESALDFHTFIQQHKSVRFPEQSFDPVTTFSTEEIQGASPWIHMELILYNSTQPVNGFPHIRSACYDIDFIGGCDIP